VERVRFDVTAGQTYYIMISGFAPNNLSFSLAAAPPPYEIDVQISAIGTVVPTTGIATIRGTATCNQPGSIDAMGQVTKKIGNGVVAGYLAFSISCSPGETVQWSSVVFSDLVLSRIGQGRAATLFTAGPASAELRAFGISSGFTEFAADTAEKRLKRLVMRASSP
jgi:hypothetical protein